MHHNPSRSSVHHQRSRDLSRHNPDPNIASTRGRITGLLILISILFTLVAGQLVRLQVFAEDGISGEAIDQRLVSYNLPAKRGTIFDRNGRDLALDVPRDFVFVDPSLVLHDYTAIYAENLSKVLNKEPAEIEALIAAGTVADGRPLRYRSLSNQPLSIEQSSSIRTLALPGVALETRAVRVYPNGDLAAPILGAAHLESESLVGDIGLEAMFDEILTGTDGRSEYERDRGGREIPHSRREQTLAEEGTDIVLTIDSSLQAQVERTLIDQVTAQGAKQGVAIVTDVATGDILAMATVIGPDETGYAHRAGSHDGNLAVTTAFEPGSTSKVVTVATALESEACDVGPETKFEVPWRIANGSSFIADTSEHPTQIWTTRNILAQSSNVGTVQIAEQCFDPESMDAALRNFGYGRRTKLGLPSEAQGLLTDPDDYYDTGLRTASIGYGVAATPMQILRVYSTLANGGVAVQPRLVAATIAADGTRTDLEVAPGRRVVSAHTATAMSEMLLGVIAEGTAPCAAIPGYEVAGKTGTTRKIGADGKYVHGVNIASFAGYAPAGNPRLAAVVILDEPKAGYGGAASAPVFSEIMQFALRRNAVVPTAPSTTPTQWEAAGQVVERKGTDCHVPHGNEVDAIAATQTRAAKEAQEVASHKNVWNNIREMFASLVPSGNAATVNASQDTTATTKPPE